ncbi:FAD/NAD(P)-binding protein [Jeotgalibaca sp. A127]|uniref:FAD/NAD(P)-binding protein n=1 Tax=Jeotgalibaca sp. A127 TaxID=3457324 RepID=UPI003FCF1FD4
MKKIAIVGVGVTGISVLKAMAEYDDYQYFEIVLFNESKTFGTGIPYQDDSELLLINQTADTMSLEEDDKYDFVSWVRAHKDASAGNKDFIPRKWYGEYLQTKLDQAVQILKPKVVKKNVTAIRVLADRTYQVETATTKTVFDKVHLCMGQLPYQDPYQLKNHPHFILHPYPVEEKLAGFPEGSRIGIIGTGLTSIDLMRFLRNQGKNYKLGFFARNAHFSLYRGLELDADLKYLTLENLEREKKLHGGFVPFKKMVEWFYLECEDKEINFNDLNYRFGKGSKEQLNEQLREETDLGILQGIIHKMDFYLADFMAALTEADRDLFYSHYEPLFRHFRTPMPKESLEKLMRAWNAGEIKVWDKMKAVDALENGFVVQLQSENVAVDYLVNATGQNQNLKISQMNSDLLGQLMNERILQPEAFGGVQVLWPSAEAVSQRYGVLEDFYVHGQLVIGLQYGNNAHLLMKQAHKVVKFDLSK